MKHLLRHLFLPHHTNNQRAKLIHHESLLLLVVLLFAGSLFVGKFKLSHPNVLGVSIDMSVQDLLLLTNSRRQENNLPVLQLNSQLTQAAQAKAANMFAENYWAHNSPSGKTPWDFIRGAGYAYVYAGENLARGFSTAGDTMNAWMASPDHRANILSPNYQDVGFAIVQGDLTGDSGTVLVVQEFGSQSFARPQFVPVAQAAASNNAPAVPTPTPTFIPTPTPIAITPPILGKNTFEPRSRIKQTPFIDATYWSKALMMGLLGLLLVTFLLDFIIIGKRQIVRIVGHNMDHILYFTTILAIAYLIGRGLIS